jgi:hypothetical protein
MLSRPPDGGVPSLKVQSLDVAFCFWLRGSAEQEEVRLKSRDLGLYRKLMPSSKSCSDQCGNDAVPSHVISSSSVSRQQPSEQIMRGSREPRKNLCHQVPYVFRTSLTVLVLGYLVMTGYGHGLERVYWKAEATFVVKNHSSSSLPSDLPPFFSFDRLARLSSELPIGDGLE